MAHGRLPGSRLGLSRRRAGVRIDAPMGATLLVCLLPLAMVFLVVGVAKLRLVHADTRANGSTSIW